MKTLPCHRTARSWRKRQRGAVAIIVGLMLVVLVGFIGLALDGGHLYLTKTELQNGADACALAASYELTGVPTITAEAFARAEAAGQFVGNRNWVGFQGAAIDAADISVTFGTSLSSGGTWAAASAPPAAASKYVRCTITRPGIKPWFMQVLGFGDQTVSALATATLSPSQTNCGIPLGVCSKGAKTDADGYGLTKGHWVSGRFDAGDGLTGNFNWIDFTPPGGGASELANLLKGNGVCSLNIPDPVGQTGVLGNAAAMAWNTRFGLYQTGSDNVSTAPPDQTGYAYTTTNWPDGHDALGNFKLVQRPAGTPYGGADLATVADGNALTGLSLSNAYNPTTRVAQHKDGADRRLVVAPIVDCTGWETASTVPIQDWVCVLMLHPIASPHDIVTMEYLGLSNDDESPCGTSGITGASDSAGPLVPTLVQ